MISWSREPGLALWGGGEQPRLQKQKEGALSPQIPGTSEPCCSRCCVRAACEDHYERHMRAHTRTHLGLAFACLYVHRPRRHGPTQAHSCPACKTSPAQESAGAPRSCGRARGHCSPPPCPASPRAGGRPPGQPQGRSMSQWPSPEPPRVAAVRAMRACPRLSDLGPASGPSL